MKPRYKVTTVSGYAINPGSVQAGHAAFGVTASVLDTRTAHRELARFSSNDRGPGFPKGWRGIAGALREAEEYAAALNAGCEPA